MVGLCLFTLVFLGYRGHRLQGWNVFDAMSATASINPQTQVMTGTFHSLDLAACSLFSMVLLFTAAAVAKIRDF